MCIKSMANDGGLRGVLHAADRASGGLSNLSRCGGAGGGGGISSAPAGNKRKPSRSLSEMSSSSFRHSNRMDLSVHSSAELKHVVAPLIKEMEKLDAAALLSLNPTKDGRGAALDPRRGLTVPPIHDRITPSYKNEGPNIVRYLHVSEVANKYSLGIFVFPPGTEIPLHDHPDMVVVSRVLYGELRVKSFDVLPDKKVKSDRKKSCTEAEDDAMAASSPSRPQLQLSLRTSLNKIKDLISRTVISNNEDDDTAGSVLHVKPNLKPMGVKRPSPGNRDGPAVLSAPSVTCLYPHEGNCHSFVAGPQGAAVLDVLLPPYNTDEDRDCTFYEASEDCPPSATPQDGGSSTLTLTPIDQPEDFHCLGGSYGRFGACNTYAGDDDLEDEQNNDASLSCNLS